MTEIPSKLEETFISSEYGNVVAKVTLSKDAEKINQIITYLHADKKLRDKQFAAVAAFAEKTGVVISDMRRDPAGEQFTKMLEDMGAEVISTGRPINHEGE